MAEPLRADIFSLFSPPRLSSSTEQSTSSRLIRKHKRRRRKQRMRQIDRVRLAPLGFECSCWLRKGSRTGLCLLDSLGRLPVAPVWVKSLHLKLCSSKVEFELLSFSFHCLGIPFFVFSKTNLWRRSSMTTWEGVGDNPETCILLEGEIQVYRKSQIFSYRKSQIFSLALSLVTPWVTPGTDSSSSWFVLPSLSVFTH